MFTQEINLAQTHDKMKDLRSHERGDLPKTGRVEFRHLVVNESLPFSS